MEENLLTAKVKKILEQMATTRVELSVMSSDLEKEINILENEDEIV